MYVGEFKCVGGRKREEKEGKSRAQVLTAIWRKSTEPLQDERKELCADSSEAWERLCSPRPPRLTCPTPLPLLQKQQVLQPLWKWLSTTPFLQTCAILCDLTNTPPPQSGIGPQPVRLSTIRRGSSEIQPLGEKEKDDLLLASVQSSKSLLLSVCQSHPGSMLAATESARRLIKQSCPPSSGVTAGRPPDLQLTRPIQSDSDRTLPSPWRPVERRVEMRLAPQT
ncbi:hypothetical protein AOLI_G00017670 [Acnodon oligacanthus]